MRWSEVVLALPLLALAACGDTVMVQLQTGALRVDVDADALALPAALESEAGAIAALPCGPTGMCPSSDAVPVACEAGVCDPAPRTLSAPLGEVVDVDALIADARELLGTIDAIEIVEAEWSVPFNRLTIDLPETEIFWAPEGAATVDPAMGVVALGVAPPLAAGATEGGAVVLSAEGSAALSRYLVETSRRVRFFVRTRLDLAPGDPFPAGVAEVAVDLRVRITGTLR